jgi:transcriptional regulator GlxA family with amidase domain
VLIVAGGPGWIAQTRSPETLAFIRRHAAAIPIVSVCTGGLILAASGVLDGKSATTKREVVPPEISPLERLRIDYPDIETCEASLVDEGSIITGGGVSLCIDTILHLLKKLFGPGMAAETARIIEYQRAWSENLDQFPPRLTGANR